MWKNVDIEMISQNGKKNIGRVKLITKREVFGPIVQTPEDVKSVGYNGYLYENVMRIMRS